MKSAFVTGISSGVGKAVFHSLGEQGYRVAGVARNIEQVGDLRNPDHQLAIRCDLLDAESLDQAWEQALQWFGGIPDVLICNAGMGEVMSVEESDMSHVRACMEVNYFAHVWLVQRVLAAMRVRGHGRLVFLGSLVTHVQFPFKAQYCASKSALSHFALSLAHEVHPFGIRVHLLEPGWIRSGFHHKMTTHVDEHSPYTKAKRMFLDYSRDANPSYPDGPAIAREICRLLAQEKDLRRRIIGRDARGLILLKRFLPLNWAERLMTYMIQRRAK